MYCALSLFLKRGKRIINALYYYYVTPRYILRVNFQRIQIKQTVCHGPRCTWSYKKTLLRQILHGSLKNRNKLCYVRDNKIPTDHGRSWKISIVTKNHEFPFCMIKADMFPYQNKTRILKKKTFFLCEKCTFWGEEITQNWDYGR